MTLRTVTLDELKRRSLEDVLREVADRREVLTVRLPDGTEIRMQSTANLRPLPVLKGRIPEGWKDGVHE